MSDLISIVMPVYNSALFLAETIESVLKQTYVKWELILVDDASEDNGVEIIQKFQREDKRIKLFKLNENQGAAVARNTGIKAASGKYIAFLDSDDLWLPEKLERQYKFMEKEKILFSCSYYEQINEHGEKLDRVIKAPPKSDYKRVLQSNPIGTLTAMYNAQAVGKIYGPNIKKRNDYALWLNLLKKVPFVYCYNEILAQYRIRRNSLSRDKRSLLRYHWDLYRKYENLSVFASIYHLVYLVTIKLLRRVRK